MTIELGNQDLYYYLHIKHALVYPLGLLGISRVLLTVFPSQMLFILLLLFRIMEASCCVRTDLHPPLLQLQVILPGLC